MKTSSKNGFKGIFLSGLAGLLLIAASAASAEWRVPRTEHGYPDLQGIWSNATLTSFERPAEYGDRLVHTPEEVETIERNAADTMAENNKPTDPSFTIEDLPKDCGGGFTGVNCGYNSFWVDPGTRVMVVDGQPRTSIVTNPKNGQVPDLTPAAQKRRMEAFARYRLGAVGPEVRPLGERCIMSFGSSAGPAMTPLLYNNNYQIVQTEDHVMILVEMVHDARIIRLENEHNPQALTRWMGDSIGRYEGDTLVVETINLRPEQSFHGAGPKAKFVERFTRTGPDKIKYEFTAIDPESFTQAEWGGEIAFNRSDKPIYEYACHEGNYALPGILAGARMEEKEAAAE